MTPPATPPSARHTSSATKKAASSKAATPSFTVPGISTTQGGEVAAILQQRLDALNDLALTLKHVHWNVVGPHFIAVHEMLDPQVDAVRLMVDTTAERIATLGAAPVGTPGALVANRTWDDYSLGRAGTQEHLGALELVYQGVVSDHRAAMDATEESDPVTQDMLIAQLAELEQFHWFVRAHLEDQAGHLSTEGQAAEKPAAKAAQRRKRSG